MSKKYISIEELYEIKRNYIKKCQPYCMRYWSEYDYSILTNTILSRKKAGRGDNSTYNDIIIMCDTETSKKCVNTTYYEDKVIKDKNGNDFVIKVEKYNPVECHVVAWTISLRAFNMNLCTLYGNTPDEFCQCLNTIQDSLKGDETFFYWHNMPYDYVYIRKYMFKYFGHPNRQLNVKPHYPIYLKWDNGITFKDSLILSQRKLEKWADDLNVEHKKAVEIWIDEEGNKHKKWDYDKIRNQSEIFSRHELDYIEHDTLAGVECIDATMQALHKRIYSMPYTATGIPREECRKIGKKNGARQTFLSMVLSYEQYIMSERVYHGGYTHANRYIIDRLILNVICRDFSSSYPYTMLSEKFPMEKFAEFHDCSLDDILSMSDDYAFMFKLTLVHPRLKDAHNPMPVLQFSKCVEKINPINDNGRILEADYIEIYVDEVDASIIKEQYSWDKHICTEVIYASKDYLPRWFTDYVYKLYSDKCTLKDGDPVLYSIAKAKLNSLYGMCVQKCLKENMVENFVTGEYEVEPYKDKDGNEITPEEAYQKYVDNNNSVLLYQWGIYITSFAMKNLFELSKCCIDENGINHFCYSDTDSIYSTYWNEEKLDEYNSEVVRKLKDNNYTPVEYNGKTFTPGLAEFDGIYSEFKVLGAKRYCCRYADDKRNKEKDRGKLKITVAGVPKNGVKCLNDDINNFTSGFIFKGTETGKLTHHYIFNDEIVNDNGISRGDCVDLTPCDYLLSSIDVVDIDDIFTEEIEVQVYD